MTLQDASDLAQVISAVAVVVSLVYVAHEVRHNSRQPRLSKQQAQADAASQYLTHLGTDPAFLEMVRRHTPPNVPTEMDRLQATLVLNGVFVQFQAGWEAAALDRRGLKGWWTYQERAMSTWLVSPIIQDWWARDRMNFSDDFRAAVDRKIAAFRAAAGAATGPTDDPA